MVLFATVRMRTEGQPSGVAGAEGSAAYPAVSHASSWRATSGAYGLGRVRTGTASRPLHFDTANPPTIKPTTSMAAIARRRARGRVLVASIWNVERVLSSSESGPAWRAGFVAVACGGRDPGGPEYASVASMG